MEIKQGEEQKSGSGKSRANDSCRYAAEAPGKQPLSGNSNLSLNAHLCTWWGMAEEERNNNQQVPPSCSSEACWNWWGSLKFRAVPPFTHAFNNISCELSVLSLTARYAIGHRRSNSWYVGFVWAILDCLPRWVISVFLQHRFDFHEIWHDPPHRLICKNI